MVPMGANRISMGGWKGMFEIVQTLARAALASTEAPAGEETK